MKRNLAVVFLMTAGAIFAHDSYGQYGGGYDPRYGGGYYEESYAAPVPPPVPGGYGYGYRRPPMPGPGCVWVDSHWGFRGGRYVWVPGFWGRPPHAGAHWVSPRYDRGRFFVGFWSGGRGGVGFGYGGPGRGRGWGRRW